MRALQRLNQQIEHLLEQYQELQTENIHLKEELKKYKESHASMEQLKSKNEHLQTQLTLLTQRLETLLTL